MLSGLWPNDCGPEYADAQETICWPESGTGYIRIKRKEIKKYITNEFLTLVQTYRRIKQYGWPQGKGYLAEPQALFAVVELFDSEKSNYQAWTRNNDRTD